jgi:hypothetical protein
MPPQSNNLIDSLAGILAFTKSGQLEWEAIRHPEDGEVMFYKAAMADGEFTSTLRLNIEEEDGGPSLGIAYGNHPLDPDDDLILRDHIGAVRARELTLLIETVQAKEAA